MAGIQWSGGQHAGARAAKAALRHNDKEERLAAEHSNEDIDKSLTAGNWSMVGGSYEEKCRRYDERLARVMEGVRVSSGANSNNTLQGCVVYEPETLDGQRLDREQLHVFYGNVYDIACEMFGEENVIAFDIHVDELHNYIDPVKGEVESRIHGHLAMIPAVSFKAVTQRVPVLDADGNPIQLTDKETGELLYYVKDDPLGNDIDDYRWRKGDPKVKTRKVVTKEPLPEGEYRLNWNEFCSKANIIEFNKRVHEMCQETFGIDYMTGEGKHAGDTVEGLKRKSRIAEAEAQVAQAEASVDAMREAETTLKGQLEHGLELRDSYEKSIAVLSDARDELVGQIEDAVAERDGALDEAKRVVEDAWSDMAEARQRIDEAAFEAEVVVHVAVVDAEAVHAAAESDAVRIREQAKRETDVAKADVAEGERRLEMRRHKLEQEFDERARSLDAYADRLAEVDGEDRLFVDYVNEVTGSKENMNAFMHAQAVDGKSADDELEAAVPDPSRRGRIRTLVMNAAARLLSVIARRWQRDRQGAVKEARREYHDAAEAARDRYVEQYGGDASRQRDSVGLE